MSSIDYYNQNAQAFVERTIHADLSATYAKFLSFLVLGARILDAGCGSGRDSLYFMREGFDVLAFDGSIEMAKSSSKLLGAPTLHLQFQDLTIKEEFDAVWASASLLHVAYEELPLVFQKLHRALKPSGILYASFKYGEGQRAIDARLFSDMKESSILPYLGPLFTPLDMWTTPDNGKAASPAQAWLNILLRKQ